MFSAGRVLIKPEGDYSPLKTYEMLDYVSYNGSSYIAKKTTTGNLPTDTEYWQLSASGAQSQNVASNFAEVEGSDIASSPHDIDDVFVNKDGKLLKATLAISIGDTIVIDTNCEPTTVEDLISYLSTQVSNLNSSNKKLNGITEIAVQTDLHTLGLGEFYKDKTSFYVTNGPEEVDEVASAIFRLTVESALNDLSTTRLLTLKTPGGKVYTQNYDGSSWGDWEQVASKSEVELLTNNTYNVDDTAITEVASDDLLPIYDTSESDKKKIAVSNFIGGLVSNPNLLDNPWFTVNQRGFSTSNANGFTVDRWKILQAAGTVSLSNGAITIDPTVSGRTFLWGQTIEDAHSKLAGKTVTLSVMLSDGTIKSKSFDYPTDSPSSRMISNVYLGSTHYFELYEYSSGHARVGYFNDGGAIPSAPITIKAVKLELGSVSTLAMDTVPNYTTELLKCQRYFCRIGGTTSGYPICVGRAHNATQGRYFIKLPVEMRSNAVVTVSDLTKVRELCNHQQSTPTAFMAGDMEKGGYMAFYTTTSGLVTDELVGLLLNAEYINISADL